LPHHDRFTHTFCGFKIKHLDCNTSKKILPIKSADAVPAIFKHVRNLQQTRTHEWQIASDLRSNRFELEAISSDRAVVPEAIVRAGIERESLNSPLVAHTVHHARDSPIEDAVTRLEGRYMEGTSGIVLAATGVCHAEAAQIGVLGSAIAAPAPLRPRYHE